MTHVKNVEGFARILDFCTGYGGKYNPGRPTLQLESMFNALKAGQQAMEDVKLARVAYEREINKRKLAHRELDKLVTAVYQTLKLNGASKETLEDVQYWIRKLRGSSRKSAQSQGAPQSAEEKPIRSTVSNAFVSRVDYFGQVVACINAEPLYRTSEPALVKGALLKKLQELRGFNARISALRVVWSNAIAKRNELLYLHPESLYNLYKAVKSYLHAAFGLSSEAYEQVKSIKINLMV